MRFLHIAAPAREWLLLVLCIVLAFVLALLPDVSFGRWAINHLGYWQMWMLVVALLFSWLRGCGRDLAVLRRWWRGGRRSRALGVLLLCGGAAVFAHLHFPHRFKILGDEAALVNTSQAMHQQRLTYMPTTGLYRNGIFLTYDGFIDKRPYFHPFLVSLVHDLTGYRWNNGIGLNAALTVPVFAAFFLLGRRLQRRWGGAVAVGLAAGIPIFAQTFTGSGFESLNLLLVLVTLFAALRYRERASLDRLGVLVSVGLMLAYTRYESGLYLVAVGVCIWWTLVRKGTGRIPWPLYFAPLLCVPLVWLQLIAFADEYQYFQLAVNQDPSAFGVGYLARNLASAWRFFAVPDATNLSSPLVWAWGVLGIVVLVWRRCRSRRHRSAPDAVFLVFAGATLANVAIFLFFNYGQYSQYITQRISVPVWGLLVLLGVFLAGRLPRRIAAWLVGGLIGANLVVFYLPAANGDFHEREYVPVKDFEFVRSVLESVPDEQGIFVFTHMPPYWLCQRCPCSSFRSAVTDKDQVLNMLKDGSYARLWVHTLECTPTVVMDAAARTRLQPPPWFDSVEKRLVAKRWLVSGVTATIYEIVLPRKELPPTAVSASTAPSSDPRPDGGAQ